MVLHEFQCHLVRAKQCDSFLVYSLYAAFGVSFSSQIVYSLLALQNAYGQCRLPVISCQIPPGPDSSGADSEYKLASNSIQPGPHSLHWRESTACSSDL